MSIQCNQKLKDSGNISPVKQNQNKISVLPFQQQHPHHHLHREEHHDYNIIRKDVIQKEIPKGVIRKKLSKMRHLVIQNAIQTAYLESIFQHYILPLFEPQTVTYNGGIAKVTEWKISCYLEVMEGGIPCTNPNIALQQHCLPLLDSCNELFIAWYKQQHSCNGSRRKTIHHINIINNNINKNSKSKDAKSNNANDIIKVKRLMTFITRYSPAPGEQALLKHVDGAGKVDGSVVVALPIDRWSGPEEEHSFEGFGGGLTFWDGKKDGRPMEIDYDTRCGDIAFIDKAVWHQGT